MGVPDSISRESDPPSRNLALASESGSAARPTTCRGPAHTVKSSATNRASLAKGGLHDAKTDHRRIPGHRRQPGDRVIGAGPRVHQREQERPGRRRADPRSARPARSSGSPRASPIDSPRASSTPITGAGFHGLIAFDADGDGNADYSTWIDVGPDGEVPLVAQLSGPACRGLTNLFIYFTECVAS